MTAPKFDPVAFYAKAISILGGEDRNHGEALRALHAESYKRGMLRGYLLGFNASEEGYNDEYPFGDNNRSPEDDAKWAKTRAQAIEREAGLTDVPTVREGD